MAATFEFVEDNGAVTASHGTTRTGARVDVNWKALDDSATAYTANPIVAGQNSFQKNQYGHFSGTFNQILNGLWAHTATAFGAGLVLKGLVACTTVGGPYTYVTPSQVADTGLTVDMSAAVAIGSGVAVWFGATGPEATGKAASMATNPCWSSWLTTQLQTTTSAVAGDTAQVTLTLQYDEN